MSGQRGQPPKITPERYDTIVDLVRSGLTMQQVADTLGVARRTLYYLADREKTLGARIKAAKAEAAAARRPRHGSESCYVNNHCRRPECVEAATRARTERRQQATARLVPLSAPAAFPTVYEMVGPPPAAPLADTA